MDNDINPMVPPQGPNHSVQAQEVKSYRYGDFILEEGGVNTHFLAILSGQVQVLCRGKKVRVLSEHDVMGLEAILFRKPSTVSAMALTTCRVAFYGPEALNHFLRNDAVMSERLLKSLTQQLAQTTQRAADGEREFALDDVKMRFFNDNEVIIEEGSVRAEYYKLVSTEGGLRMCVHAREVTRLNKPGEFFGEMEALLGLPGQATVTSIGQSVVQVYPSNQLPMMVESYPEVALRMIRDLASRLIEMNRRFVTETP